MADAAAAIERAKAIAAKLNATLGMGASSGGGDSSSLGKRGRWGDAGDAPRKKKKVYIPRDNPEFNFISLLIGPRGSTQKRLEESSGARIVIRGRGSEKEGDVPSSNPEDNDELHVCIEGSDEAIEAASREVEAILNNPQEAMRLKQQQLRNLAEIKGPGDSDGSGHYGPSSGGSSRPRPGLGFGGGDSHYGPSGGGGGEAEELEVMKVPSSSVGLIIGRGGENVQRIQRETGCLVQIAKESETQPGDTTRSINLRGSRAAIADCKRMIEESMEQRPKDEKPDGSKYGLLASLTVMVPNEKVGIVIGRSGATIRSIQERTGAEIRIPRAEENNDPNFRTVNISASNMEAAEAAQAEINAIMSGDKRPDPFQRGGDRGDRGGGGGGGGDRGRGPYGPPENALIMHVKNEKVGLIIGRGGSTIRDIQARSGTRIQIPPEADPVSGGAYRVVNIQGPGDGPDRARYEIESIMMSEHQRSGSYLPYEPCPAFQVPAGGAGVYQPQAAAAAAYYQQPSNPYAAYGGAYQDPYAAYYAYGAYAQPQHQPEQHQHQPAEPPQSGAEQAEGQQGKSEGGAAAAAAGATGAEGTTVNGGGSAEGAAVDLAHYHKLFWDYAQFYGEETARQQYGEYYSPPVGTPVPDGIVLPTPEEVAQNIASLATDGAAAGGTSSGAEASETPSTSDGPAPPAAAASTSQ